MRKKLTSAEAVTRILNEATANLSVASAAMGISQAHASRLIAEDAFPVPVIRMGARVVIPTPALRELLQISTITAA